MSPRTLSVVTLRLLGGASVEGSDGPIAARGARGRRLALLSLLAAARGRAVTRDKLLALLWPEADGERARPLLSDALYLVRSALGEDALVVSGDELRLNGARLSSDVETFERLLDERPRDERRLADAVAAYGGPFLDGFHVGDAPEFERWVDGQRARLAERFAGALDALALASERREDWDGALGPLRRLAAHDPYSGRTAARLMRALDAAGNRAAALQHARLHAALLREEFDADPDPEVAALVARLKSEPAPARPSRTPSPPVQPATPAAPTHAPAVARRARWRITRRAGTIALVALLVAAGAAGAAWLSATRRVPARVPRRSIAVLPFDDLGPGRDGTYFSDGLTEELIGALGRVDGLRVAAQSSSFALRGSTLGTRTIGDTLHVATLLEGSVRREGDRVRVTAQLVDAADGYQLWSKSYDRRIEHVIALQNEIATDIVGTLALRLAPPEAPRATPHVPNAEVYDEYLRGVFEWNKHTRESLPAAVDHFDRAIRLDSTYAPAWAGKALAINADVWFWNPPHAEGYAALRAAAARAVALDPTLSTGHVALGMKAFFFEWDWPEAEREFRRAIALNANDANAHHFLANVLLATGRLDEAIAERQRALALDPLSVRTNALLGQDYYFEGKYDLALQHYRRASEMDPRHPVLLETGPGGDLGPGHVYEREGRYDAAVQEHLKVDSLSGVSPTDLQALRRAYAAAGIRGYWRRRVEQVEREPAGDVNPVRLAWMSVRAGDGDRAVRYLERAHRERSAGLMFLGVSPEFETVRADPRVIAILRAMRLRPSEHTPGRPGA